MPPILHLSIPVTDLAESRAFYLDALGCAPGRERPGWADIWFYGMQVTLQERPAEVLADQGTRHFGVTLDRADLDALVARLDDASVTWLSPLSTDFPGTPQEQTKAKLADPSGNVIEVKSYADPTAAWEVDGPTPT